MPFATLATVVVIARVHTHVGTMAGAVLRPNALVAGAIAGAMAAFLTHHAAHVSMTFTAAGLVHPVHHVVIDPIAVEVNESVHSTAAVHSRAHVVRIQSVRDAVAVMIRSVVIVAVAVLIHKAVAVMHLPVHGLVHTGLSLLARLPGLSRLTGLAFLAPILMLDFIFIRGFGIRRHFGFVAFRVLNARFCGILRDCR